MKKTIATLGILLTMAATAFTGTVLPASAHSTAKASSFESWSIDDDCDDDEESWSDNEESWDDGESWDDSDIVKVTGTKHFLALRSEPAYSDSNIIGKLHNGDEVIITNYWKGDYVRVYSPDYDCYGWVDANYLR